MYKGIDEAVRSPRATIGTKKKNILSVVLTVQGGLSRSTAEYCQESLMLFAKFGTCNHNHASTDLREDTEDAFSRMFSILYSVAHLEN